MADTDQPDVTRYATGVSSDEQHTALRASVRQLAALLGEALTRHEGPELLALVEQVRALAREHDDGALHDLLAGVDDDTAVVLARAFTGYFQLVNVTEQLHRWQEVTAEDEGPLAVAVGRIGDALAEGSVDVDLVSDVLRRVEYRPVFTAHPTEASRRTVLRAAAHDRRRRARLRGPPRPSRRRRAPRAPARRAGRRAVADRRAPDRAARPP